MQRFSAVFLSFYPTSKIGLFRKTCHSLRALLPGPLAPIIGWYNLGEDISEIWNEILRKIELFPEHLMLQSSKEYFPLLISILSFCCEADKLKEENMEIFDTASSINDYFPEKKIVDTFCASRNPYFQLFLAPVFCSQKLDNFFHIFIDSFVIAIGKSIELTKDQFLFFCEILLVSEIFWPPPRQFGIGDDRGQSEKEYASLEKKRKKRVSKVMELIIRYKNHEFYSMGIDLIKINGIGGAGFGAHVR